MKLLTFAVYLPIAAAMLLFVYLTTGGFGLVIVAAVAAVKFASATPPKPWTRT